MKTLPPATGTVKWLPSSDNDNRCIRITTAAGVAQDYEIEVAATGGYNLLSLRETPRGLEVVVYQLRAGRGNDFCKLTCTCPDATRRQSRRCECKHVLGLRAAFNAEPF